MRYREPFTIFPRKNRTGKSIWYFQTYDESGKRTTARSTGQKNKAAARTYVTGLLKAGNLQPRKDPTFKDYFGNWWTWDKCQYVQLRKSTDPDEEGISPIYVENCRSFLDNHILPFFRDMRLSQITVKTIEQFKLSLLEKETRFKKPMAATSVNHILRTLKTMYKEAVRIGDLSIDPAESVQFFKEKRREKDFLSPQEIRKLFDVAQIQELWDGDLKHYTLNLLSASTGMRLGECQALQNQNVMDGYIRVWYSWGRKHGLKATKNKEKRSVPIPAITQSCLSELLAISPYQDPDDFLFWGIHGRKPVDQRTISEVLYEAFERLGISEEQRSRRNITFHIQSKHYSPSFRVTISP